MWLRSSFNRVLNSKHNTGVSSDLVNKSVRCASVNSVTSEKYVVKSPYKDVDIPKIPVNERIWRDIGLWPEKTAVICGVSGRSFTYSQLYTFSRAFAVNLRKRLKLENGDVVAIMLPNMPEFTVATLGSLEAGCVVTPLNPIYTAHEVGKQLSLSTAKVVITTMSNYKVIKDAIGQVKRNIPVIIADCVQESLPDGAFKLMEFADDKYADLDYLKDCKMLPNDLCLLPYSSGTTGLPKGVELTNRNITANCEQFIMENKISHHLPTNKSYQDTVMCVLPFFHIYGLTLLMLSKLAVGCKLVTLPRFKPETFVNAQSKYKPSLMYAAPPIVLFLGSHPSVTDEIVDSIRVLMSAAAPVPLIDVERLLQKNNKIKFVQGYGLTETSPLVTLQELGSENYKSIGQAIPGTECKIVSLETQENIGPNEVGELFVRGPQVMRGYRGNPQATADAFATGGWFKTGDLSYYDEENNFYIADRLKELIKVKGYQVPPAELEHLLREHPHISDAAVIGIPHDQYGETPKAFVVVKNAIKLNPDEIKKYVAERVAPYKRLGDVQFIEAIPKNASGKILRQLEHLLREHPHISDAAVIGIPHDQYGETPKAFVVVKNAIKLNPDEIKKYVAERVAPYKRLGDVQFIEAIPKNASGKILRREIKAKFC